MTNNPIKIFSSLRLVLILAGGLAASGFEAAAQNFFLTVRTSPTNAVQVNSTLTYTIGLTNLSPFDANSVFVTNALPASFQITGLQT